MSAPFNCCLGYPGLHPTFFKETIQSLGLLACLGFLRTDLFFSLGPKEYGKWHLGLALHVYRYPQVEQIGQLMYKVVSKEALITINYKERLRK